MIRTGVCLALALVFVACDRTTTPAPQGAGVVSFRLLGRCGDPRGVCWRYDGAAAPEGAHGLEAAIERAASEWNATGLVAIDRAAPPDAANVVVSWHADCPADCAPFLDWEGSLAHARGIAGPEVAAIHLDSGRGAPPADELHRILVHELGHVVGLGHSDDERAIMYPSSDPSRSAPAVSDRAALASLYGDAGLVGFDAASFGRRRLDVDGDGLDEELVWRLDPGGASRIQTFHLDAAGRATHSTGPWLSSIDLRREGASIEPLEGGGAVLLQRHPENRYTAWGFDADGKADDPWHPGQALETAEGPEDLDGDGVLD